MILVRHAESEWNLHYGRTRIDPGIPDPPLTAAGRAPAERLTHDLAAQGVARLISSPYRRALETASIIAHRLGLAISVEPLVRERCAFSCDHGSAPDLLRQHWPTLDFAHLDAQWWGVPEETHASIAQRCATIHAKTADLPDRAQIAVISHWGFIRAATGQELSNATFVRLHVVDPAPDPHPKL
jgi:broad specificity phosphatase PhoE